MDPQKLVTDAFQEHFGQIFPVDEFRYQVVGAVVLAGVVGGDNVCMH